MGLKRDKPKQLNEFRELHDARIAGRFRAALQRTGNPQLRYRGAGEWQVSHRHTGPQDGLCLLSS
jgi:hypothetical protein